MRTVYLNALARYALFGPILAPRPTVVTSYHDISRVRRSNTILVNHNCRCCCFASARAVGASPCGRQWQKEHRQAREGMRQERDGQIQGGGSGAAIEIRNSSLELFCHSKVQADVPKHCGSVVARSLAASTFLSWSFRDGAAMTSSCGFVSTATTAAAAVRGWCCCCPAQERTPEDKSKTIRAGRRPSSVNRGRFAVLLVLLLFLLVVAMVVGSSVVRIVILTFRRGGRHEAKKSGKYPRSRSDSSFCRFSCPRVERAPHGTWNIPTNS